MREADINVVIDMEFGKSFEFYIFSCNYYQIEAFWNISIGKIHFVVMFYLEPFINLNHRRSCFVTLYHSNFFLGKFFSPGGPKHEQTMTAQNVTCGICIQRTRGQPTEDL